jgi:putative ABC transport system permease protein
MSWLKQLFGRRRTYGDLSEEIRQHLEEKIEELVAGGMSRKDAAAAARREFGNVTLLEERGREVWQWPRLESFLADIHFGFRMLRKSPGFTTVAILTLALGIGANTAIFSAVNGILLQPLPYADSSRLVIVKRDQIAYYITFAQLHEIQQQCTAIERMARFGYGSSLLTGGPVPEQISPFVVSSDFFPMLGVKPLLGRTILPEDTQPGHDHVALLSFPLWMDRFGGDAQIVGRGISLDHQTYTVIGVMPKEFGLGVDWSYSDLVGGNYDGMWVPQVVSPQGMQSQIPAFILARLKDGATLAEANAQLRVLSARFAATYPARTEGLELRAQSLGLGIDERVRTGLLILLGAVGFVLLMACVNVTSLLVACSWTRQQELAVRRALGASRLRLVRQLLSESLLMAIAGGTLGGLFSLWGINLIRSIAPSNTPRIDYIQLNGNVLWFTMGISLIAAVMLGLVPALHATSRRVGDTLKGGLSGSFVGAAMRQSHGFRSALVVLEVAMAVIVVAGGALMAHSFYKLMHVDTGVRADHVITMSVQLSDSVCKGKGGDDTKKLGHKQPNQQKKSERSDFNPEQIAATACVELATENVLDGVRSLAGVQQAALSGGGAFQGGFETPGYSYPGGPRDLGVYVEGYGRRQLAWAGVAGRPVTPGYFDTVGICILKGRDFGPGDLGNSRPVALVSQSFADKYIPGDPLGKSFSVSEDEGGHRVWVEILGVVNDVRDRAVKDDSGLVYYVPSLPGDNGWEIIARTSANPMAMVPAIERVVRSVDGDAPITNIETVDQIIANSAAEPRFQTALLGSFGVLGLLLAMIGIYGVISYSVVQRTHEIGVRMALGAGRDDVMRMILGEGMFLAFVGIVIGVGGALALTRFLRSLLFEIKPNDPATFVGVAILLMLVALAACYIPARRAMRVDPMVALRYE